MHEFVTAKLFVYFKGPTNAIFIKCRAQFPNLGGFLAKFR